MLHIHIKLYRHKYSNIRFYVYIYTQYMQLLYYIYTCNCYIYNIMLKYHILYMIILLSSLYYHILLHDMKRLSTTFDSGAERRPSAVLAFTWSSATGLVGSAWGLLLKTSGLEYPLKSINIH